MNFDAPVLCFDTCSILDILRDITRTSTVAQELEAARQIVSAIERQSMLSGMIAPQVHAEFFDNVEKVSAETVAALEKFRQQVNRIDALVGVFGQSIQSDLRHLDGHVDRCRSVVDRLLAAATIVPEGPDIVRRAYSRVNTARTPARKGRDAMKDCVVIETYLEAASQLRAAGYTAKIVFASSNTRDYAGETGSKLRPDLAGEFATLNMEYAPNLAAARHFLGL